jgi:hypothetical protein
MDCRRVDRRVQCLVSRAHAEITAFIRSPVVTNHRALCRELPSHAIP